MKKFKRWFIDRFLPEYRREEAQTMIKKLDMELSAAHQEIRRLKAYIEGMHTALRAGRKIVIKNGGGSGGDFERSSKQ